MRVLGTIVLVGMLSAGGGGIYVVEAGDTLTGIAHKAGASVAALTQANRLSDPDRLLVGQRLTVPDRPAPPTAPSAPPGTYVVQRGDTIARIAARAGISQQTLIAANGLVGPTLYAGSRLRLVPLTGPGGRILYGPDVHGGGGVHVVKSGETLATIATRNGTTVRAIADANGLRNANRIRIGQRLTVPGGSTWVCPVQSPKLRFVNDWGFPRAGGRAHEGTDLLADRGSPVVAPVAGVVTQKLGSRAGRQVTLQGDDGFVYIGAHLNSFGRAGRVRPGDVIGTVGTSGDAEGGPPHLHFEIHPRGIGPVNPYPTLREMCRAA